MPMPKPDAEALANKKFRVNGRPAQKLVKVVKPFRTDRPNLLNEMVDLAKKKQVGSGK